MTQQQPPRVGAHAVVIGSGIAGLLAARTLADYYDRVSILERDVLPNRAEPRKGVPQGRHAHALLARGQQILEELFPGLTQRLIEAGAARGHGRFFSGGGYLCRVQQGPGGLFVSRPCLEHAIRSSLMSVPSIAVVEGCAVEDLVATADGRQVIGVRVSRRHPGPTEEIVLADLVVDCSGRGSRAPVWLEALGYPKPDVELVDVGMGYSTRFYQREPEHLLGDMIVNVAPSPENRRACGMMAQEGDRWIVTLAGYFGDHPPTDEKGFLAFAGALAAPEVHDIIRVATPLSDPVSYRFRANQWRHYERLARFPAGFLVFGDAICSFTPIYGQGMTVAALEALALRECLEAGTERLSRRFFKRASKVVSVAWNISAGNDMRLSEAGAGRAPMTRLLHWYMSRLLIAARRDASVAMAFLQVASFLAAPPALLRPAIAARVLWGNLTATRRQQPEAGSPEPASLPSQP